MDVHHQRCEHRLSVARRALLGGAAAWAAMPLAATSAAPAGNMTATVTLPDGKSFEFAEAAGKPLADFADPRGAFVQSRVRVTRSDFPGFRVEFARLREGSWASAEFYWGQYGLPATNLGRGYTVRVSGDFSGGGTTPNHWWGSRWRLTGSKANGLRPGRNDWPVAPTAYSKLVAERLIPDFDPTQNGSPDGISRASPGLARPYTPMGNSSLTTGMGMTGGRSDIGLFNDWDSQCLAALSPTASGALRAQVPRLLESTLTLAEAAASICWWQFDAVHGCLYERLVNNPAGGDIATAPVQATMPVVVTGPPNTTLTNLYGSLADSINKGTYWMPRSITIPSSGTTTIVFTSSDGGGSDPAGTPVFRDRGSGPAGVTFAWGDKSQWKPASPWAIDMAHCPETGYVAYLLFRDPWDLMSVQANAMFSADGNPRFGMSQVRQAAWDYRSAVCAWAATPPDVPAWLLPKSTLEKWIGIIQQWLLANRINGRSDGYPMISTVFHEMVVLGGNASTDCHGNKTYKEQSDSPWQEAFMCQAASFALLARPNDANARRIAEFQATGVDERYNGRSGWPRSVPTAYHRNLLDKPGGKVYRSQAEAWAANAPLLLTGLCPPPEGEPLPPVPPTLVVKASGNDYYTHDFAALSLAVQAGLTQFRASRDYVGAACKQGGAIGDSRAFKQV